MLTYQRLCDLKKNTKKFVYNKQNSIFEKKLYYYYMFNI